MKLDIPDEFTRKADSVRISYLRSQQWRFRDKVQIPFEKLQFKKFIITLLPFLSLFFFKNKTVSRRTNQITNNTNPSFFIWNYNYDSSSIVFSYVSHNSLKLKPPKNNHDSTNKSIIALAGALKITQIKKKKESREHEGKEEREIGSTCCGNPEKETAPLLSNLA